MKFIAHFWLIWLLLAIVFSAIVYARRHRSLALHRRSILTLRKQVSFTNDAIDGNSVHHGLGATLILALMAGISILLLTLAMMSNLYDMMAN